MSHNEEILPVPSFAHSRETIQLEVNDKTQHLGGEILMLETFQRGRTEQNTKPDDHVPLSEMAGLTQKQALHKFWKPSLFCLLVSSGAMMDGYHGSIDGNVVANHAFVEQFGGVRQSNGVLSIDAYHLAAWGGISSGMTIFGNLIAGFSADWLGRKFNMWLIWILLVLGTVIELVAKTWQAWAGAKVIIGLAGGFYTTSLVIYNAEIAPAQLRGGLISTWALGNAFGNIIGSVGLEVLATSDHALDYKRILYTEFLMEGIFLIALLVVPESPWHWARKGQVAKGIKSLRILYGNVADFDVEHEYNIIKMTVESSRRHAEADGRLKWNEMFRETNLRRFAISAGVPMAGKLTGNPLVGSYTSYFFQLAGLAQPFLVTMIVNLVQLVFITASFFTIDRFGRRTLLLGATFTISCCMLGIASCGFAITTEASKNAVVALTCIFFAAYATGIAPVGPSYQGETPTPRLRARTNAISQACAQAWGLIFAYTIPLMLSDEGAGWGVKTAFFFFFTNSTLGLLFYFFMPEYKNRSYAELDELFARRIPARKFASTKTAAQMDREQLQA